MGNPSLLFLDEPTSGLDAFTALSIIETLDSLARNNYSIVCTVHQPRYNIFELFDMLMVRYMSGHQHVLILCSSFQLVRWCTLAQLSKPSRTSRLLTIPAPSTTIRQITSVRLSILFLALIFAVNLFTKDNRTPEAAEQSKRTIEHLTAAYKQSPMVHAYCYMVHSSL